jgi:hypothetical protein
MRIVFSLMILVHGLIHVMGFAKAFHYAELSHLTQEPQGRHDRRAPIFQPGRRIDRFYLQRPLPVRGWQDL